jgi:sugar lactone lactonase YvrE
MLAGKGRKHYGLAILLSALALFVTAEVAAHPATGIVVDRQGQVFFSDLETVWKLEPNGKLSVFRQGVSGRHVHELAIDHQHNIVGADVSYEPATQKRISDVWKMTPDGQFSYLLEPTADPPPGLSIWRDQKGNMFSFDQNNHTKTRTLLLMRTAEGQVTTFAGSAYGHADGRTTAAKFSSVGGMAFGSDGSLYLTDGTYVRKVTMDGVVSTMATNLTFRTSDDKPTLFGGSDGILAGLTVDSRGNIYVADAGNRRLLKIATDGKVTVVYRADPPYSPNGVFASRGDDLYVMEVGFTLPSKWSGPRVRKISADGKSVLLATVGEQEAGSLRKSVAQGVGVSVESTLQILTGRYRYLVVVFFAGLVATIALAWRKHRRQRQQA